MARSFAALRACPERAKRVEGTSAAGSRCAHARKTPQLTSGCQLLHAGSHVALRACPGRGFSYQCAATAVDPSAGAKNTTTESRSLISQNECCSRAGTNMIVPGPTSKVLAFPSEPVRILAWP